MPPTDAELVRAIETGVFRMPTVPGEFEALDISGVQGNFAPHVPNELVNNVGDFNVPDAMLEDTIEQALATYRALGNPAYWWTGPNTKPACVEAAMESHGLKYGFTLDGLVSTDLTAQFPVNPKIRVETVPNDRVESLSKAFSAGFVFDGTPLPDEVGLLWMTTIESAPPHVHGRNYAAHLDGVEGAIAAASLFIIPGTEIAMLAGASTLPEHRGNGAYTSLIAARLRDAARFGAKGAIIQADSDTSSPICQRVGMRKVCELQIFLSKPA